ncbi:MAG: adenylate cyclase, partial [Halomonadaceae bacterium]
MPDYHARVLGYIAGAVILLTGVITGEFHPLVIWLVPMALLWPHLLYFACQHWLPQRSARTRQRLLLLDGLFIGSLIAVLQFRLIPTFILHLMINLSCIIVGGVRARSLNWLA